MAGRGGLLKLLDAYIAIGGDASGFDKAIAQSEAKTKQAGARLESAFSPRRVLGALGAAAGAAFGVMLTGANQLDAAARQLQADTGMTATEAAVAEKALAGMYRNNLQGFDEIGAAMAKVHNDLGLVGDAADATTEKFLKYATATKQDAAGAVTAFDDILDAWGLTAADAGTIMDKLVVSHQKYGGSITENQAALGRLAPQLKALNVDLDGGIALLNLFEASGLDSAKATMALNTAVRNLKPGQDLNDLIAQITSIEDPTLRAQKAVEIFGARGGVGLANALRPGVRGLADFVVTAGEAAGASDRAAEASLSWGDKWTLMLHKVGGALAEFGTQFGPLLMVAAALGPKLVTSIGAGLGGLVGLFATRIPAAIAAATIPSTVAADVLGVTTGTATGTAFGRAIAVAIPAAIILGVALAAEAIQPELNKLALQIHDTVFGKKGPLDDVGAWLDDLPWPFGPKDTPDLNIGPFEHILGGDSARKAGERAAGAFVDGYTSVLAPAAEKAGADLPAAIAKGIRTSGGGGWTIGPAEVLAMFGTSLEGVTSAWHSTGADGMAALASGITAARQKPLDAFETVKEMLKNAMTPTAEAARLAGQLTSSDFAKGMKSKDPAVRAQTIAFRDEALARIGEIAKSSGPIGQKAMDLLAAGIKSKDQVIRNAANQAKNIVTAKLNEAKTGAGTAGAETGTAFATAVRAKVTSILDWVSNIHGNPDVSITVVRRGGMVAAAAGMPYVPTNMPVYVHEREAILSVPQAEAWRAGTGGVGGTFSPTVNVNVSAGSDVSPGAARRFGQAVADEVANVLQEQNARFTSGLRVARA